MVEFLYLVFTRLHASYLRNVHDDDDGDNDDTSYIGGLHDDDDDNDDQTGYLPSMNFLESVLLVLLHFRRSVGCAEVRY